MSFGVVPLDGSTFSTWQVGQVPAFGAGVDGVPFRGGALSWRILACKGVKLQKG